MIYKILSKILGNRLVVVLPVIIEENQGSFIKGRETTSNAIIVLEIIDLTLKKDPRIGIDLKHVAIKLDIMKAYDQVNWSYLEFMMSKFGFLDFF